MGVWENPSSSIIQGHKVPSCWMVAMVLLNIIAQSGAGLKHLRIMMGEVRLEDALSFHVLHKQRPSAPDTAGKQDQCLLGSSPSNLMGLFLHLGTNLLAP